jgi:hypothetical protein
MSLQEDRGDNMLVFKRFHYDGKPAFEVYVGPGWIVLALALTLGLADAAPAVHNILNQLIALAP